MYLIKRHKRISSICGPVPWVSGIIFFKEVDEVTGTIHKLPPEKLIQMENLVSPSQEIKHVFTHKIPKDPGQWIDLGRHHQYVEFETESHWWSIELNEEGVAMQQSRRRESVVKFFVQRPRLSDENWRYWGELPLRSKIGHLTVGELVDWLSKTDGLRTEYRYNSTNDSKTFAFRVMETIMGNSV